jgi:hypothetical protein
LLDAVCRNAQLVVERILLSAEYERVEIVEYAASLIR